MRVSLNAMQLPHFTWMLGCWNTSSILVRGITLIVCVGVKAAMKAACTEWERSSLTTSTAQC